MTRYTVTMDGEEFEVVLDNGRPVTVNNEPVGPADIVKTGEAEYSVLLGLTSVVLAAARTQSGFDVFFEGGLHDVRVMSERDRLRSRLPGAGAFSAKSEIRAPMPALVVRVGVAAGDTVAAGQGLVVLEAMKMENEIRADRAGRVTRIFVQEGRVVEKDELLILLE